MTDPKVGGKGAKACGASQGVDCHYLVWRKLFAPRHLRGCALQSPAYAARRDWGDVDRFCATEVMTR